MRSSTAAPSLLLALLLAAGPVPAAESGAAGKAATDAVAASGRLIGGAAQAIARAGKTTVAVAATPRAILVGAGLASAGAASAGARQGSAGHAQAAPLGRALEITEDALALAQNLAGPAAPPPGEVVAGFSSASSGAAEKAYFPPEKIVRFAKKVEREMAARGARVAIIARMGRPLSEMPEGMRFTHVAFAVYSEITTADGRKVPGYAIHNLYQRDDRPDISDLVMDYPVDFFAGVAALEAGIIVPSAELQQRLVELIGTPGYARLHERHYSVIANPFTLGRQNCTEFVLDVTNAALYRTDDIKKIKAIAIANFEPQKVNVNPLKILLGSLFSREVSTSDHSEAPATATFERIGDYLKRYDPGSDLAVVLPDA